MDSVSGNSDFEKNEIEYEISGKKTPFENMVVRSKWIKNTDKGVTITPEKDTSSPLAVFANPKSGGNRGATLMESFREYLHPIQIFDITDGGPQKGLSLFKNFKKFRVLVCGGDGTVGWVLSAVDELGLQGNCSVAILPLGTGNDLSRVLNWGSGFDGINVRGVLVSIEEATPTLMDRWQVEILDKKEKKVKTYTLNNYFSIGMGAKLCLNFSDLRNRYQVLFSSRLMNRAAYAIDGFIDSIVHSCQDLENKLEVYLDDSPTPCVLPDLEEIIFLNIASYGGGTDLWGSTDEDSQKQKINDKLLEVLSVDGSFHMGAIRYGFSSAKRVNQASKIKIVQKKY